jgi:hypothetical protein
VAPHPPESTFEEVGDYTKSLANGRFAAQLTEIANQLSVPIVRIRGTVRPLRDWNQEHGHALCGSGAPIIGDPGRSAPQAFCLS